MLQELPVAVSVQTPVSVSIEAEMKEEERKAYAQLCQEIGFRPAALIKDELFSYLGDNQFKIYPYQEVKKYLDRTFGVKDMRNSGGHTWSWCPLREIDQNKSDLAHPVPGNNFPVWNQDNGEFEFGRTYHGAVPFAVLDLVKQLEKSVPGLFCFVSDVMRARDRKGDPFLAVTTPGLDEMIVIAVWDEPNFGF